MTLKRDADAACVSHAYLLDTPDELASALTARFFAAYCMSDGGKNLSETELIHAQKHPDVIELPSNAGGIGTAKTTAKVSEAITVADIDKLVAGLYVRPSRGSQKFYILHRAELMNPQSQNKLLKTLEEPPPSVRIILCCRTIHALLPTVASRCKTVPIRPFSVPEIRVELMRDFPDAGRVAWATAMSGGSLSGAYGFVSNQKLSELFELTLETLLSVKSSKDILDASSKISGAKAEIESVIGFLEILFRDVTAYKENAAQVIVLNENLAEIQTLSGLYSTAAIVRILPFLGKIRRRIAFNANPNSLSDELWFTIAELRSKYTNPA